MLLDIYGSISVNQTILFSNSKSKVTWIYEKLLEEKFPVGEIHGEMEIDKRESVIEKFKGGEYKLLVTTDLLARGLDVHGVSIVINYDMPTNRETYIHRIGRSGRYGRKGVAVNIITPNDTKYVKDIESYYGIKMIELKDPGSIKFI
jgi:superfamily II DNA/RNA helicase